MLLVLLKLLLAGHYAARSATHAWGLTNISIFSVLWDFRWGGFTKKEMLLTDYQCAILNLKNASECLPLATVLYSSGSFLLETRAFSSPEIINYLNIMLLCSVLLTDSIIYCTFWQFFKRASIWALHVQMDPISKLLKWQVSIETCLWINMIINDNQWDSSVK